MRQAQFQVEVIPHLGLLIQAVAAVVLHYFIKMDLMAVPAVVVLMIYRLILVRQEVVTQVLILP
jgi:hypothetical protein